MSKMAEEKSWVGGAEKKILIGFEHLPTPIAEHLRKSRHFRRSIPHVYHVTELIYCLRKAFGRRVGLPENGLRGKDVKSSWNMYRGNTYDNRWSPLFDVSQHNVFSTRKAFDGKDIHITGTLDFMWYDETTMEPILYDLKMPASVYYKKQSGAGVHYVHQVLTYLAMAHAQGDFLDVSKARVLMLADDVVIEEVEGRDSILDWIWDRTILLDQAIRTNDPSILKGPELGWECNNLYCEHNLTFKGTCGIDMSKLK